MPASASTPVPPALRKLRTRAEFLAVAEGRSLARGGVMVQRRARPGAADVGVGFTATRKLGGAVVRNRAKRRMRELARRLLPLHGEAGFDYVLVARAGLVSRPWPRLLDDVKTALISLAAGQGDLRSAGRRPPRRRPPASSKAPDPPKASDGGSRDP